MQNENEKPEKRDCIVTFIEGFLVAVSVLILIVFPFGIVFCIRQVNQYERALIFRLGRLRKGGPRGPGLFFILPCVDDFFKVDLRTNTFEVPPQNVLTKDSCTVMVTAVVYYSVQDPMKAVMNVENYRKATILLAATTLRNVLGAQTLVHILNERTALAEEVSKSLRGVVASWGVTVQRVEMRDASLPQNMKRAMAAEAEAFRDARATVINAEGEMKSAEALRNAAKVISDNPAALQLRYLQAITTVASDKNRTVIFPTPSGDIRKMFF